ncbi:MAG: Glyoxalase family protein, partial [uncultured Acetobacteraceae bacterium]
DQRRKRRAEGLPQRHALSGGGRRGAGHRLLRRGLRRPRADAAGRARRQDRPRRTGDRGRRGHARRSLAGRRVRSAARRERLGQHPHLCFRRGCGVRAGVGRRRRRDQAGRDALLRRPRRHPARPLRPPLARGDAGGGGVAGGNQAADGGAVRIGL